MVFVLDKHKKPLMPCTEKRARLLLKKGRAVVHKIEPFTIRLKDRTVEDSAVQPLRLKLDPGAKTTGMAIIEESNPHCRKVICLGEIRHKQNIRESLDTRRSLRRSRRSRKTRYRKPRFNNRRRAKNWLPPSLRARVNQTLNMVNKFKKLAPISAISTEHVKFDTQLLQNPEINGIEYQQGELYGYEIREYLLEKWGRRCAYCGKENVPLEIEHIIPKSRGGTNRISNLTLACHACNQKKGKLTAEEFGYPQVQQQAKEPLKDAAMMNATRWTLYTQLKNTGLPVECGTGARTKKQRLEYGLPKEHYYDACCVGASTPSKLVFATEYASVFRAVGRGNRQMCNPDRYGFPRGYKQRQKQYFGFQTGDIVKAEAPGGKYAGTWTGRVAIRSSGYFDLKDVNGRRICQGINYKYCRLIQRADGWQYDKLRRKEETEGVLSSTAVKTA